LYWQKGGFARSIGSNRTSHDTDLGQPCNTCNCESFEIYSRSGKVYEDYRIKQHTSLLNSMGRLMIWVSALRPYFPGGMLNTFVRTCTKSSYKDLNLLNRLIHIHNSIHNFLLGLLGYLIPIATLAFVPQRQSSIVTCFRRFATPRVSKY